MVWKPHVTVAAVIEQNQRFLLVEEHTPNGIEFNQPAGHLEANEDLLQAVSREVKEETGWSFEAEFLLSVQLWRKHPEASTYLRFCFIGRHYSHDPEQALDEGIIQTHWLTRSEIAERQHRLRSPLVSGCIDQYLSGERYPLSLLHAFLDTEHG